MSIPGSMQKQILSEKVKETRVKQTIFKRHDSLELNGVRNRSGDNNHNESNEQQKNSQVEECSDQLNPFSLNNIINNQGSNYLKNSLEELSQQELERDQQELQ